MAQDIRELFKKDIISNEKMPKKHQERFLQKLDRALPEKKTNPTRSWLRIAASIVIILGLSFGGYQYFKSDTINITPAIADSEGKSTTLGDVSPDLKMVEDYYLASINLELSKIKPTSETKDLFDSYLEQLDFLDHEYKRLSEELNASGPSELTINALIDNLKLRLNLLYRLRAQLKDLNTDSELNKNYSSI